MKCLHKVLGKSVSLQTSFRRLTDVVHIDVQEYGKIQTFWKRLPDVSNILDVLQTSIKRPYETSVTRLQRPHQERQSYVSNQRFLDVHKTSTPDQDVLNTSVGRPTDQDVPKTSKRPDVVFTGIRVKCINIKINDRLF